MADNEKKKPDISLELDVELINKPLKIKGQIPHWLSGTLIRNGPVSVTVDGKTNNHVFDGLAMLHSFSFEAGQVKYSNKFLRTDAYDLVFKEGSLNYSGFASDPCKSLFKRLFTFFLPPSHLELNNANINVVKMADSYFALYETPLPIQFDPYTLETLGILDFQDKLPHRGWESAHPHYDFSRSEIINYLIEYGLQSNYVIYRLKDGSKEREVIAKIPVKRPSYMHTFAVTENYIVLTEFPFVMNPLEMILKNKPFIKNFKWYSEQGTQFIVINRNSGKILKKYKTNAFFAFHHANAFEKGHHIHLDIICYDDPKVIYKFSEAQYKSKQTLAHFILNLKTESIQKESILFQSMEFPRINEKYDGQPYRFLYLCDPLGVKFGTSLIRSLYKIDVTTKKVLRWEERGCFPGEPVFIPAPNAIDEDDGVVLAVIFNSASLNSFLVVLDGKSFKEVGRAQVIHAIPEGLHGQYFPDIHKNKR